MKRSDNKLFSVNFDLKKKCEKICEVEEQQWTRSQDFYEKTWIWELKSDILSLYKKYRESKWFNLNENLKVILQFCKDVFREQS